MSKTQANVPISLDDIQTLVSDLRGIVLKTEHVGAADIDAMFERAKPDIDRHVAEFLAEHHIYDELHDELITND